MTTTPTIRAIRIFSLIYGAVFSAGSYADGLSDLHNALDSLKQTSPFAAKVNASLTRATPDKAAHASIEGHTQFTLKQNLSGLEISYPSELLSAIDKEASVKKQNPQAPTPTTDAMNRFKYAEFSILFNPVRDIQEDLRKATLVKEEPVDFQGQAARLLHLQIPLEKLSEEEQKNLKKYQTDLKIWINEKGIPLASRSTGNGSGRFAVVIGFEFHFDVEKSYITYGDRLLVNTLTSTVKSSGAGMNDNETIKANLALAN